MANEHPFQMLFESLGRLPLAHAESVNRQAYEILYDILSVPVEKPGRCILLRAPRAGHGKTHLLSRIQHHLGSSHEFIPLRASFGSRIDAPSVIDDALRRLLRPLPASGGLCVLDLVARRLFASALQPLVGSGEVPCQDREGALTALRTRPIETFDFHHPNAVTAHWARENFEVLGQRLSLELVQRSGLPAREVSFWVDALFRFAATPVDNPARLRVLADVVHTGSPVEGVMMERLQALLGLLAQLMRVVLVADDLEGFSTDESAALRLAAFIGEVRQSVERLDVVLSLNQDIWDSAFVPRLSGGLADRLSEVVVELNPLSEDEMVALLESRVPGLGSRVLSRLDRGSAGTHARGLIRAAGVAWLKATAGDAPAPVVASAAAVATPAVSLTPEPPAISAPVSVVAAGEFPSPEPPAPVFQAAPPAEVTAEKPEIQAPPVFVAAPPLDPPAASTPEPVAPFLAQEATPTFIPEPAPEPIPEPPPVAVAPIERAPDPTLAIAFLAAQGASASAETSSWPSPDIAELAPPVAKPVADFGSSPFEAPGSAPAVDLGVASPPVFAAEPPAAESVVPQAAAWAPAMESPFQAAVPDHSFAQKTEPPLQESGFQPYGTAAGAFQVAPETQTTPVFQPTQEPPASPAFQAAPEPEPSSPFQPAPEVIPAPPAAPSFFEAAAEPPPPPVQVPVEASPAPVSQAPAAPVESQVPDTDRVDDLLRQFRERYGRGSM